MCLPSVTCALGPVAPNPRYLRHPSRYLRTSWCVRWIDGGVVWTGHARTLFQFDLGAVRYGARSVQHGALCIHHSEDRHRVRGRHHSVHVGQVQRHPRDARRQALDLPMLMPSLSLFRTRPLLSASPAGTCLFVAAVPHMLGFTSTSFSFTCTSARR